MNKALIPTKVVVGQTSDGMTIVKHKYFELPENFPEVSEGYKCGENHCSSNIKDFFTEDDFAYMMRTFQFYDKRSLRFPYYKSGSPWTFDVLFYPESDEIRFTHFDIVTRSFKSTGLSPKDVLEFGYEYVRNMLIERIGLYDFKNTTVIPNKVSREFGELVTLIDSANNDIRKNFIKIAFLLNRLSYKDFADFSCFGVRNIYEFAERRWGYGSTSVKNFLALHRFMSGEALKPAFESYGYSQLVELVSVPDEMLEDFSPDMTIQEMREANKKLLESLKEKKPLKVKKADEFETFKTNLSSFFWSYKIPYADPSSSGYKVYRKALREVVEALNKTFKLKINLGV